MAPVYDCGSSLFALYSEERCKYCIDNPQEFKNLVCNCVSAMSEKGNKIKYYEYIKSLKNESCTKALIEIFPKIDIEKINEIIDNISILSDTYKIFYKNGA